MDHRFGTDNNYGWEREDPNGRPKYDLSYSLAVTACVLGICSIAATFFMPVVVPAILAPVAIVLAIISRGSDTKFLPAAKRAVVFAAAGLAVNAAVAGYAVHSLRSLSEDPYSRSRLNQVMQSMYGQSFEQILEDLDAAYGTDLSGFFGTEGATEGGTT